MADKQADARSAFYDRYKNRYLHYDYNRGSEPEELFLLYHLNSDLTLDEQQLNSFTEEVGELEEWAKEGKKAAVKSWFGDLAPQAEQAPLESILLPPRPLSTVRPIESLIRNRRSLRQAIKQEVPLEALSYILENSMGVTYVGELADTRGDKRRLRFRAAPSGGGLYPVECYVLPLTVKGMEIGLYHYAPETHSLEKLRRPTFSNDLSRWFLKDSNILNSAAIFMYTAKFMRSSLKYGERSYRFIMLETGCIIQNMILCAEALGFRGLPIGGFIDDSLNEFIGCSRSEEAVIMCGAFGTAGLDELKSNA